MLPLKPPSLPKDLFGRMNTPSTLLTKTANALAPLPKSQNMPQMQQNPMAEQTATLTYLADVLVRLFQKLEEWRFLPLEVFEESAHTYLEEVAATLTPEVRAFFFSRAEVYVGAVLGRKKAEMDAQETAFNEELFHTLLRHLEAVADEVGFLLEDMQADVVMALNQDFNHTLEGGVAVGFISAAAADVLRLNFEEKLTQGAIAAQREETNMPTLFALQVASKQTRIPEVDALPKTVRQNFLVEIFNQNLKKETLAHADTK